MSLSPLPRRLLRRPLLQSLPAQAQLCRSQRIGRRWYAAEEKDQRDSFKGQLYQSTHERVQRERADQERFAQYREAEKSSSSLGLTIPLGESLGVYNPLHVLTKRSTCGGHTWWMAMGQANASESRPAINCSSERDHSSYARHSADDIASSMGGVQRHRW